MKRHMTLFLLVLVLAIAPAALGQTTGTTSVQVTVGAESTITITTGTTTLTEGGTAFSNFSGTTNFSYKIRTSQTTGSGSIVLKVTTDFSPTGGPSVGSPPNAADTLTYACAASGSSSPTPCASVQTASTSSTTPVLTVGADAHTNPSDSGSVSWTLVNDPKYKTGSYSATVTFTISAS